jgi:outer membrane protein assembly factor BamA
MATQYEHVRQEDVFPAEGRRFDTYTISPFAVIDRRNSEWYPSRGAYARIQTTLATGTVDFARTIGDLRAYWTVTPIWPLNDVARPPVIALRATGGTSTAETPSWSHFFTGFNQSYRGYRTDKAEAAGYLSGQAEFRFPLIRESTYSIRQLGSYGSRWPSGLSGFVSAERYELQLDGSRTEGLAFGGGLLIRVPYVQLVEAAYEVNRDGETAVSIESEIRF